MGYLSPLLPERSCTVRVLQLPRVQSTRAQPLRSLLCSRTRAQAKLDTPDQPIPTQTNGTCAGELLDKGVLQQSLHTSAPHAGVVQTVVAAATSLLRLGQLG